MRTIVGIAAFLAMWASAEAACTNVPAEVAGYLAQHPGWRIVQIQDLVEDDQRLWQQWRADACPGMAQVDFDGSGHKFHALALLGRWHGMQIEKVVAFRRTPAGLQERTLVRPFAAAFADVIAAAPPGVARLWDSRKQYRLPFESLVFQHTDSAATKIYWADGEFRSVPTVD